MVAAAHASVAVGRDERYGVGGRAGEAVGDDVRRELGQPSEPALLPARPRPRGRMTRRRRPSARRRTRAAGPSTRGSAAPATPSARRSARSACRAGAEARPGSPGRDPHPDGRRKRNGGAAGGREPHRLDASSGNPREWRADLRQRVLLLERVFVARREPGALAHQVVRVEELLRVADVHPVAGEAVAVDRLARVEPDDEVARRVRRVAPPRDSSGSRTACFAGRGMHAVAARSLRGSDGFSSSETTRSSSSSSTTPYCLIELGVVNAVHGDCGARRPSPRQNETSSSSP